MPHLFGHARHLCQPTVGDEDQSGGGEQTSESVLGEVIEMHHVNAAQPTHDVRD